MKKLVAVVLSLITVLAAPAHAAHDFDVSSDGSTWTSPPNTPLFAEDLRWVPGDSRVAHRWVRNVSGRTVIMSAKLYFTSHRDLYESGHIALKLAVGAKRYDVTIGETTGAVRLQPGEVTRIGVQVDFDEAATNPTQGRPFDLGLAIVAREASAAENPAKPPAPGGSSSGEQPPHTSLSQTTDAGSDQGILGALPAAGTKISLGIMAIAVGLIVSGGWLKRRNRSNHA